MDVCIILGSGSDLPIANKATVHLDRFGIVYEVRIASAHRASSYLEGVIDTALAGGCKVFIGMAGLAAALPGVIASMTSKPVIGVPVGGKVPLDSLLSIVQMPPGMPVATVGVDRGDNAAILAIQILSLADADLAAALTAYREEMTAKVIADDEALQSERGN
jgi:5-(carboxyamino)imidazole ribonucleotide mutase